MSKEWPTKEERKQNMRLFNQLLKQGKIKIKQSDIDMHHRLMKLSPSKRLEIAVSMIVPRKNRKTKSGENYDRH